jgi:Tol biopolymer transport system component
MAGRATRRLYDVERGIGTRLFDKAGETPSSWTPSADEITYNANRGGNVDIFSKASSGSGEARLLVGTPLDEGAADWSPDRRYLIYMAGSRDSKTQLLYRERRPDGTLGEPVVFRKTAFNERAPRFSPGGRFVAYTSIFVRPI